MNWESNQSKAIPFIIKDQSDTYSLTPQASQFLTRLQGPLTIITVAGLYRTGKSYLLNRVILNRSSGFGVGPTVNPCTKGLWLWAQPIRVPEGRTLLVIDTEGLGALDEESNHDMKIFSLAVLLSTNFIYNSVGSIDQTALQTLSLALQLIGSIDKDNYSSRPSLLWVIRDFSLELINSNGESITASDYLELALSTEHIKESSKVSIRKIINQAFSKRDCCTLIKPLIDEQKLQTLDQIPSQQLRPEFVSQTIALRKNIFGSLKDMKLNNSGALSGKEYAIMIEKYLTAINAGQMPNLMDTWSFIKAQKARAALEFVRDNYNEKLRTRLGSRLPLPSSKLQELLSGLRTEAIIEFQELSYQETVHEDLEEFLSLCENEMNRANAKQTKNIFGDILRREFEPFQKKLLSEYYTDISSYENDLKQTFCKKIIEKINDKLDVPTSELNLFAERKIVEAAKLFERKAKEETVRIRELKNETQNALQQELRKIGKNNEEERRKYQEELLAGQRKIISLATEKQRLEETLEKERKDEAIEAEKFRRMTQENQGAFQHLTTQTQRLSSLNADQQRQLFSLKKQLEKEKALSVQKEQYMTVKLQEQQKRIQQLSQDLNREAKQWEHQKRQMLGSNESHLTALIQQNKEMADQLQEITHHYQHEKYLRNQHEQEISLLKNRFQEEVQHYKERLNTSNKKESRRDDQELNEKYQEISESLAKSQRDAKEWESKYKQVNQNLKNLKNNFEKETAIFNQKMEFQQIQISELKVKNVELNESYQRYLEHAHTDNKGIEEMYSNKISEMNSEHQRTLRQLQEEYQRKVKELRKQVSILTGNKQDLELQISLERKKAEDRQTELREALKKSEESYEEMIQRLNNMELDQSTVSKEKELFYQGRIKQLELQLESIHEKNTLELQNYNKKTEENVAMLKNYADMERAQWQKRLEEEKEKNNRKINELNEDWTRRLNEEKEPLENNIQQLTQRLQMTQNEAREQIQSMKCDFDIKLQKINNAAIQERMELNKRLALTTQEAQMTKTSLLGQLEEKTKTYQQNLNSIKKQMAYECEQQIKAVKEALEESQQRNDSLRKANRKSEENNFLIRSELDKDKALFREKLQNLNKERRQLQERYLWETQAQNKAIEELNTSHSAETRRLNDDIDRLRHKLQSAQQEIMLINNEKDQQRQSSTTKINYLEQRIQRSKKDNEDLLRKFQTTVKILSKNNKVEAEKEFQDRLSKVQEDYKCKIIEKEKTINQDLKERDDKIIRLQTQNKTLRDRLLIFEMRESGKKGRNQQYEAELNRMQQQYQRKIMDMKKDLEKYARLYKQAREEKDALDSMIKSRISDRSERHSFISQAPSLDVSTTHKGLRQNKSLLNYKLPVGTTTKKQEKRYNNLDEGIMRWQQH